MAKRSTIAAEKRRRELVARFEKRRDDLRERVRNAPPGSDELRAAVVALEGLPRDSSLVRLRTRDRVDGRPRGYVRKTGTSRIRFRELAHRGELPGIRKSSW